MKTFILSFLFAFTLFIAHFLPYANAQTVSPDPIVGVCFTSGYGSTSDCASLIVFWIGQANSSVHVLINDLTLPEITQALTTAAARGVDVKIVMDSYEANSKYSQYPGQPDFSSESGTMPNGIRFQL